RAEAARARRARDRRSDLRGLPALPRRRARRPVGVRAGPGLLAAPPLAGRTARRHLGRPPLRLRGDRAARLRLAHAPLLDADLARRLRPHASRRGQPRGARLPLPVPLARCPRVAAARRGLRPLLPRQPGDSAQRPEPPLAAALAAAVRARALPRLPCAGDRRRPAAGAHGDRRRQLGAARRRRRAVGALAVGRLRTPAVAALAAVAVALATACGERAEPTGPTVTLYPVT